ncbi:integrin alpha-2-like [Saccostrea cucullata]|uniref:integrin alpha-2-like n=1 Tax=Saccostrea cuccullata TaxID=36930 RepID=UPI002ECFBA52
MDFIPGVFLLIVLTQYGVICSQHNIKRFLFDPTTVPTTPDPVFLMTEVKYLHEQLHELSDKNIELSVHNSLLSSELRHQKDLVQALKTNITTLETTNSKEKGVLNDKIHELQTKVNESSSLVIQLTNNLTSCALQRNQLEETLNTSNAEIDLLKKQLNDSVANQTHAALMAGLQANISRIQKDCDHQNITSIDKINLLQDQLNRSTSLIGNLEANLTTCTKSNEQREAALHVSRQRNKLLETQLNNTRKELNIRNSDLDQCQQMALAMSTNIANLQTFSNGSTPCLNTADCGLDLVFLVDQSGSVGSDNFEMLKDYIFKTIQFLNIGPHSDQVGVVTYATLPQLEFTLNTYPHQLSLLKAVQNISYNHPGLTMTASGLQFVRENLFNVTNGDRPGHPNVLVLLTDGRPMNSIHATLEAEKLKNQSVEIFVIGISKNFNRQDSLDIATDSNHVLSLADFGTLHNPTFVLDFLRKLMNVCKN